MQQPQCDLYNINVASDTLPNKYPPLFKDPFPNHVPNSASALWPIGQHPSVVRDHLAH